MIERITKNEERLDTIILSIKELEEALSSFKKIKIILKWLTNTMEVITGLKTKKHMSKARFPR